MQKFVATLTIGLLLSIVVIAGCTPQATPPQAATKAPSPPPAPAAKTGPEAKWETVLAAAKKEGRVTIASSIGPETRDALIKGFSRQYGIELDFILGTAAETLPRIQSERRAGLYTSDATINGTSSLTMFKRQGLLQPLEPALVIPEVTNPGMWFNGALPFIDKDRTGIGFLSQYNSCVLRNTDLVKEGEITSYLDLLKPQWKDKLAMIDPSVPGSGNAFYATLSFGVWNVEETGKWFRQMLKEQKLTLTRDSRLQLEWVARGKYPVGLAVNTDPLVNFLASGAPIAQQKVKEGGFITSSIGGLGMFSQPAHPNGAIVFANWLLSREGQIAFTSGFGGPSARKDVKAEGVYAALTPMAGDKAYVEDEEKIAKKVELQKVAAQIIAEAAK